MHECKHTETPAHALTPLTRTPRGLTHKYVMLIATMATRTLLSVRLHCVACLVAEGIRC